MWRAVILAGRLLCVLYTGVLILPWFFGNRLFVGTGGSMLPAIQNGTPVIERHCHVEDAEIGDIVCYWYAPLERYIVHRVVDKGAGFLITRGDANGGDDPLPVTNENMVGKVVWVGNALAPVFRLCIVDGRLNRYRLAGVVITATAALWFALALLLVCVREALPALFRSLARHIQAAKETPKKERNYV